MFWEKDRCFEFTRSWITSNRFFCDENKWQCKEESSTIYAKFDHFLLSKRPGVISEEKGAISQSVISSNAACLVFKLISTQLSSNGGSLRLLHPWESLNTHPRRPHRCPSFSQGRRIQHSRLAMGRIKKFFSALPKDVFLTFGFFWQQ